ncbi:type II toxin-antitoxin system VapC family toxin [Rhodoferax lacus]|uniref:type II toxin-antitoxin system VapC family toxin n=1 Tax=Rhodoferax lacus TaxID=2184758 RepID=UPI001314E4CF|nr:PIN domain-containing protein [Rhodoferax lacus]
MIAFLDANALIYQTEGKEPFASQVRSALVGLNLAYPGLQLSLSRLSWLECRVGPMKSNDTGLLQRYDSFFALPDLVWVELTQTVVELAAQIRATHGLKTPDCLQAACCLQLGNDHVFVTGDGAFQRVAGLHVLQV